MTQTPGLIESMRKSAADVEFEDASDPTWAAKMLREGAQRIAELEQQARRADLAMAEMARTIETQAGLPARPDGAPDLPALATELRALLSTVDIDPMEAANIRGWADVVQDQHALTLYLLDAHRPGEVDSEATAAIGAEGLSPAGKALALLQLAKARGAFAGGGLHERLRVAEATALAWRREVSMMRGREEPEDAGERVTLPIFRLARKAWANVGLTTEDIEAEGHRFRAGSGGYASIGVLLRSVDKDVPNRADVVPALARLFVGLFEPIPTT